MQENILLVGLTMIVQIAPMVSIPTQVRAPAPIALQATLQLVVLHRVLPVVQVHTREVPSQVGVVQLMQVITLLMLVVPK